MADYSYGQNGNYPQYPPVQEPYPNYGYPQTYYPPPQPQPKPQYYAQQPDVNYNYFVQSQPSHQQFMMPSDSDYNHHHYEKYLQRFNIVLILTITFQVFIAIVFFLGWLASDYSWQILLGFICTVGELICLFLSRKKFKNSIKKKKKCKKGGLYFLASLILFVLAYCFTFCFGSILINGEMVTLHPSPLNLVIQITLRILLIIFGWMYYEKRMGFD